MAEYGEWNQKGATLSEVSAQKEYGVSREFIINGIKTEKLEYREGAMHGNPYLRILRSQLEAYIKHEYGTGYLNKNIKQEELRKVKKEINILSKKLSLLQDNKIILETYLANLE